MPEAALPFFTRYGFSRTENPDAPLVIEPYPEICTGPALRATIIASAIDLVGGLFTREIAGVDALMTSDLSLRIPEPSVPGRLLVHGERIRTGRKLVTTGVRIEGERAPFAYGETTFVRVHREKEDAPPIEALETPAVIPNNPLTTPLDQEVGIQVEREHPGKILLDLRPALLNPEGIMQGALVDLVVECAALSLAEGARPKETPPTARHAVTGLDLRYLSSSSVGPVVGEACWLGPPRAEMMRVEMRDQGRANRLTASALIAVRDLSAPSS